MIMIISISPPSSYSHTNIEKLTKNFFTEQYTKEKNSNLFVKDQKYMVLVKKREVLLSFDMEDLGVVSLLQNYLKYTFSNSFVCVDIANPITDALDFVIKLPTQVRT